MSPHLQDEVGIRGAGEVEARQHEVGHGLKRGREGHRLARPRRPA